jgi:hypothetical protein
MIHQMPKKKVVGLSCCVALMVTVMACDKSDKKDKNSPQTSTDQLPLPDRVVRSGNGFDPIAYTVDIDLKSGLVKYEQTRKEFGADTETCEGHFSILEEIDEWKEALSSMNVCYGTNEKPISDGFVDKLELYYPRDTVLPDIIYHTREGEFKYAVILEKFNPSVEGVQHFTCNGEFKIDQLIKTKADCLEIKVSP